MNCIGLSLAVCEVAGTVLAGVTVVVENNRPAELVPPGIRVNVVVAVFAGAVPVGKNAVPKVVCARLS